MLSDEVCKKAKGFGFKVGLNALSSIVCFLTKMLSHCSPASPAGSQCPLEHCMLSDKNCKEEKMSVFTRVSMPSRALYAF